MNDQLYPEPENPYQFEKELKSTGKVKATGLVTTALIIAGGLLGGAAFAVNAQGDANSVAPGANQTVVDNGSPAVTATDPAAPAPAATDTSAPVPTDPAQPVAGGQSPANGSANPAPAPAAPAAPSPSATTSPKTIAVPPTVSFGGGEDGDGQNHDGKHKRDRNGATTGATTAPNFGNGDDDGQDD